MFLLLARGVFGEGQDSRVEGNGAGQLVFGRAEGGSIRAQGRVQRMSTGPAQMRRSSGELRRQWARERRN
eukprot:5871107-Alexandrium_andersonii.AAC.1